MLTYDGTAPARGSHALRESSRAFAAAGGARAEIYTRAAGTWPNSATATPIRSGYPDIPRRVSGYNLPDLLPENGFNVARALIGTESTCVTILEATLKLIPSPRHRVVLALGFDRLYEAGDAVPFIREFRPIALEGIDDVLIELHAAQEGMFPAKVAMLPRGNGWLLVEFGGEHAGRGRRLRAQTDDCAGRARRTRPV